MTNRPERWSTSSKTLHWLFALLIAIEVPAGLVMARTYGASFQDETILGLHNRLAQIHLTIGWTVLVLVTWRLYLRLRRPAPEPAMPGDRFKTLLARLNHGALYACAIIIPLSGWSANSVLGDTERFGVTELWLFGWDVMPPLLPQLPLEHPFGYGFFASIHRYTLYTAGGLLALHVTAALWHHLVRKDGVLLRMWPAASPDR